MNSSVYEIFVVNWREGFVLTRRLTVLPSTIHQIARDWLSLAHPDVRVFVVAL